MAKNSKSHKLAYQIARLCEKQYRKGVQHGATLGITESQASAYRATGSRRQYRTFEGIGENGEVFKDRGLRNYLERLQSEAPGSCEELRELLADAMFAAIDRDEIKEIASVVGR